MKELYVISFLWMENMLIAYIILCSKKSLVISKIVLMHLFFLPNFNDLAILISLQSKKVLVFLASGFESLEFSAFTDILVWARVDYGHRLLVGTRYLWFY